ncbi:MAG: amidohydrolase family protein [Chloroflexi bacterium]|nr:amidohydrolase family protein [Chloroflexota bacterium]
MKVIDFQHHYVPLALAERYGYQRGKKGEFMRGGLRAATIHDRLVDLDWQVRDMDAGHIDLAVLSCVVGWDAPLADCQLINDELARVEQAYPGRFLGLANVPIQEGEPGLAELERAVRALGLRGAAITSQVTGKPLDAPGLGDFYRAAQELDVPIFVHPAALPEGYEWTRDYDLGRILGRELDLVVATTRLIVGGVLDAFPRLRFVIAHFGGGVAAVKERLVAKEFRFGTLKRPFEAYFSQLAFDTAGFEGAPGALTAALTGIKPAQLVFATDYPQDFTGVQTDSGKGPAAMADYVELFRQLPCSDEEKAWMLGGHAAELLKLEQQPHRHIGWA